MSGRCPAIHPRSGPPPSVGCQGSMDHKVRLALHHPSPRRGVEGSRRVCTESSPQPCPPASPSGDEGRSSRPAGSQQIHPPPRCSTPSHTALTWAEVTRGVDFTHQEAPAASSADVIALYKQYAALEFQASFSVKSGAGYEEASISCRLPIPSAVSCLSSQPLSNRRCQRWRNHRRFCGKPATRTNRAQTEPLEPFAITLPPHLHRPAPSLPPAQAASPAAPPPI